MHVFLIRVLIVPLGKVADPLRICFSVYCTLLDIANTASCFVSQQLFSQITGLYILGVTECFALHESMGQGHFELWDHDIMADATDVSQGLRVNKELLSCVGLSFTSPH